MAHPRHKIILLIVVFALSCAAVVLTAVCYGTEYWVTQHAEYTVSQKMVILDLRIGLFTLHYEQTPIFQSTNMKTMDLYRSTPDYINLGVWVCTLIFLSLGIVFGVVSAIFAATNSAMTPIEEITGVTGLYLWNGLACLFNLITILLFVGQYCNHYVDVIDILKETFQLGDTVVNQPSDLNYSFYIMCGVTFIYFVNLVLVYYASKRFNKQKKSPLDGDGKQDGVIMLY